MTFSLTKARWQSFCVFIQIEANCNAKRPSSCTKDLNQFSRKLAVSLLCHGRKIFALGEALLFLFENIWGKFPIQIFLNFRKMLTPPLRSNSDIFEFENILTTEDPLGQTPEMGYLGEFLFLLFRRGSESNL